MAASLTASGQSATQRRRLGGPPKTTFHTEVPAHSGTIVLGRPTQSSVTLSVLLHTNAAARLVWGTSPQALSGGERSLSLAANVPQEIIVDGLRPDTRYHYELREAALSQRLLPTQGPGTFHTARPAGAAFTFTITADSHLDENTDPGIYQRTLALALADAPDFHIDLGDTFMTEKHPGRETAARQHLAQRYYFGQLCHAAPLFFVLGNHDGESLRGRTGDPDSLAVWSNLTRKRFFPNPVPDGFHTGNATPHPQAGLLEDYFAWTWGDALFVVLEPYWFTPRQRGSDNWGATLGLEQYRWLERTLNASQARFKFVFIHQLVGGVDNQGRGGVEAAPHYEWGGRNPDGTDGFGPNRPGWSAPIHRLLVQNRVSIVFHGHDHFYARQDLDGIVYQEVPQPGYPGDGRTPRSAPEYGYRSGTLLGSPGYLRVEVAPVGITVSYVQPDGSAGRDGRKPSGRVTQTYSVGR
jgi:predicted phosphodiesterase